MKLVSFRLDGRSKPGVVLDGWVHEITSHPDVKSTLAQLDRIAYRNDASGRVDDLELLPPVPNPGKIVCVGLNYDEHRMESKRPTVANPTLFSRWADTQVGHRASLLRPHESVRFDYEGELALAVGKPGRHIDKSDALAHVAGYACYNDGSVRDWQKHTSQFLPGKNFPATGGFGPWLVVDEIEDPHQLTLTTRLNGVLVQESSTDKLIFDIPTLLAYVSTFTELNTGDVVVTGTPGGVGDRRDPPLYMKPGDVAEVEITGIGILANPVAEPS